MRLSQCDDKIYTLANYSDKELPSNTEMGLGNEDIFFTSNVLCFIFR